uniref:NADH dehydrogenase subunit 2 n=1 Tax=Klapperibrachys cremeri TaxID=3081117 RepID=UPI002A81114C|nr:NADH dehydrogenase subunit 2 [Klapperibrachys cremeri]WOW99074.1 NADH dehydrogenase subunit 2 [Klapperibrachys cremeri]
MKMNSTKLMFMTILLLSTLMVVSSNNILMSWMAMEMNLFMFLPLMTKKKKMKDQPMKYFIIQSLSSSTMLMSILMNSNSEIPLSTSILLMTSMLMKMGMMPFHLWMPMIMNKLSWNKCFLLSTWQKIAPVNILSQLTEFKLLMLPMCVSLILAPISAIKQLSMKKIMAYSSISNTPWMITSMMISKTLFSIFMFTYSIITFMMMKTMKNMNLNFINQMMTSTNLQKMNLIVLTLSISGMPPTTGFLPKWLILNQLINLSETISVSMITSSIISTFLYMKMSKNFMTSMNLKKKIKKKSKKLKYIIPFNMLGFPLIMILKSS